MLAGTLPLTQVPPSPVATGEGWGGDDVRAVH